MGKSVGEIELDLTLNDNGFNKAVNSITGMAKTVGKTLAAAFAIDKLVGFSKECLDLGSDLAEVQNVVDVAFGPTVSKIVLQNRLHKALVYPRLWQKSMQVRLDLWLLRLDLVKIRLQICLRNSQGLLVTWHLFITFRRMRLIQSSSLCLPAKRNH